MPQQSRIRERVQQGTPIRLIRHRLSTSAKPWRTRLRQRSDWSRTLNRRWRGSIEVILESAKTVEARSTLRGWRRCPGRGCAWPVNMHERSHKGHRLPRRAPAQQPVCRPQETDYAVRQSGDACAFARTLHDRTHEARARLTGFPQACGNACGFPGASTRNRFSSQTE